MPAVKHRRKRRAKRRNTPKGFHLGRGVPSGSWLRNRPRRRKRKGTWKQGWAKKFRTTHHAAAKGFRRNPPRRRRRSRARVVHIFHKAPRRRRRAHAKRRKPVTFRRRRRTHARRSNPFHFSRRRRHARRRHNPGFFPKSRGIFAAVKAKVRDVFQKDTALQIAGGAAGLSVSLWGPKLLGFKLDPRLGRGWGGVATSVASVAVVSGLVSTVNAKLGKAMFVGGLIGSFTCALSALSCKFRAQVIPLETALLACALPTKPAPAKAPGVKGLSGSVAQVVAGEQSFRKALGLNEFVGVSQSGYGSGGLSDFTQFTSGGSANPDAALAAAGAESF